MVIYYVFYMFLAQPGGSRVAAPIASRWCRRRLFESPGSLTAGKPWEILIFSREITMFNGMSAFLRRKITFFKMKHHYF